LTHNTTTYVRSSDVLHKASSSTTESNNDQSRGLCIHQVT